MIDKLPPRERELFETLYVMKQASAAELQESLAGGPGNSAIRAMLRRLEAKGFVTHREEDGRFIYSPAMPDKRLKQSALQRFVETYFGGSPVGAAAALIGMAQKIDPGELRALEDMIARVRREEQR